MKLSARCCNSCTLFAEDTVDRMGVVMGAVEIGLRDYRETDLEAMFLLDEICFAPEFRFDRESMRAFAGARNAITVVGEQIGGAIAGFVIVQMERTAAGWRGYVVTLDVSPECRRAGLGGRLMREAEARAFAAGARWMELHVFTGNEGAIRFYERLGYVRVGVEPRFYGATAEAGGMDAFVYRKELTAL
jgi:ribosomal-protein-alanine N-acetyltransferase